MAHLLGADRISLRFGTRTIFDSLTLGIDDGDRIGVVGPNGAGKSTLLKLIAGSITPNDGRITRVGGLTIGFVEQKDLVAPGKTVQDVVHGDAATFKWASDPVIRDIHDGLISDLNWEQQVDTLSGGQRRRVALAAVLAADPDLLLLDEPTNHLDVEGVDWLARYLQNRYGRPGAKGALVVVTHDRWFLDAVASRIWEVVSSAASGAPVGSGVAEYDGGYAAYILSRAERARQAGIAAVKRNNLLRKELAWLRRGAPARTSKPKFRLDAAAELIADEPPPRDILELTMLATKRLGKDVLDLEDVSLAFKRDGAVVSRQASGGKSAEAPSSTDGNLDPSVEPVETTGSSAGTVNHILQDQTLRIGPGDRYGIVGVNGAGKSTLLALLAGRLQPDSGRIKRGKTIAVAELSQSGTELDEMLDLTPVRVIEQEKRTFTLTKENPAFLGRTAGGGAIGELTAAQLVERLGFTRERAHTRVGELSGGERRRLQLARLLVQGPNVLLLDEPTNDLDTDTLAAIEDLLDSFGGTLIVVSHDRYLLERVTDRQWAMYGDGKVVDLPGGVDEYLAVRRKMQSPSVVGSVGSSRVERRQSGLETPAKDTSGGVAVVSFAPTDGSSPPASPADKRQAKKDLAKIERRLNKIEEEETKLHNIIADNPTNYAIIAETDTKLKDLGKEKEKLEEDWLTASEIAD